jgi:catechol 2,3-dioxygenase-like lactoylglutathione lyase family enzyme
MHHVALRVADMIAARRFYVDIMGYAIEWEPDADNLYLTMGCDNLALHKGDTVGSGAQRLDHIGFVVESAADVAAWETYLRAHQVEILAATRTHRDGATSCYVRGFCGTALQIIHHPPISPTLAKLPRP